MATDSLSENGEKLFSFLEAKMRDGSFTNYDLVQFIALSGGYLNIKTIPDYAKDSNMSYNGVKKYREIVKIFNVSFAIDNE